jgi:methyl-accepting chemotaxis protein WspA
MVRFRDLTIKAKLYGLVFFSAAGITAVLGLSLWVLYEYRVNGPIYDRISRRENALAEVEPAVFFTAQAYLVLVELSTVTDAEHKRQLEAEYKRLEKNFLDRENYWRENLYDGPLKTALIEHVFPSGHNFFQAARDEFLPALAKGDPKLTTTVLTEKIRPLFFANRDIVDQTVKTAKDATADEETKTAGWVRFWLTTLIVISLLSVFVMVMAGWLVTREIVRPTRAILNRVSEMATGASDLTARVDVKTQDEVGQLATAINGMMSKIQSIVQRVRESSVQLLSTAAEIGAAARQQESTVQALSASTTEIAASVREISATGKELSTTMDEVSERAERAASLADAGNARLVTMQGAVKKLVEATGSVASKLGVIREKADGINLVVTTITKVADQTNLLSINAAIEAEKAGEYGRGFLVVAREIRRLADQTAVATLDIENMVRHMQDAVSAGVMQMDKFSEEVRSGGANIAEISTQVGQIIEEVHALSGNFQAVNAGVRNQSIGAEQINEAMTQMTSGTQQTRASLEEFNRATAHLRSAVESVNQEVAQFKV